MAARPCKSVVAGKGRRASLVQVVRVRATHDAVQGDGFAEASSPNTQCAGHARSKSDDKDTQ